MIINGIERGFEYTTEASFEIEDICENHEMKNLGKLFTGKSSKVRFGNEVKIAIILNKWFELKKQFELKKEGKEYTPVFLKEEDFSFMDMATANELDTTISLAIKTGKAVTVQSEPIKQSKKVSTVK